MNICKNCSKETSNPNFCCRSCSTTYNNRLTPKRKPEGICYQCGKLTNRQLKYCKKCWEKVKQIPQKYNKIKNLKKCSICNENFESWKSSKRIKCLICSPLIHNGEGKKTICLKCNKEFENNITINGKRKHLKRKCCLKCQPIGYQKSNKIINGIKNCLHCQQEFPATTEYFNIKSNKTGQIQSRCKKCWNKYMNEKNKKFKKQCCEYLGGKCIVCNYKKYYGSLEFHHTDPSIKEYIISQSSGKSFENTKKELDKCVLVCSNCHGEIHGGLHNEYLIGPSAEIRTQLKQ